MSATTSTTAPARDPALYRIDPLDDSNYAIWKAKVQMILEEQDLWGHVTGTKTAPAASDPKYADWERSARSAKNAICLRLSDTQFTHTLGCSTAKDVWESLRTVHEARGPVGIVSVRRRFFRAHCEEGEDIPEHIKSLRSLQDELARLGSTVGDQEFVNVLLTSLPDSWDGFIQSINNTEYQIKVEKQPDGSFKTDVVPISSKEVVARVLEEDRRRKAGSGSGSTALISRDKHGNAHTKSTASARSGPGVPKRSEDCRARKTGTGNSQSKTARDSAHTSTEQQAFAAYDGTTQDSGTTRHLARDRSIF